MVRRSRSPRRGRDEAFDGESLALHCHVHCWRTRRRGWLRGWPLLRLARSFHWSSRRRIVGGCPCRPICRVARLDCSVSMAHDNVGWDARISPRGFHCDTHTLESRRTSSQLPPYRDRGSARRRYRPESRTRLSALRQRLTFCRRRHFSGWRGLIQAPDCDVCHRVPGVVNTDKQQQQRCAANSK